MPPHGVRRTHDVHITEPTGEKWLNLPFRDYLGARSDAARGTALRKPDLAIVHRADRKAYTDAKAAFVEEILTQVRRDSVRGGIAPAVLPRRRSTFRFT